MHTAAIGITNNIIDCMFIVSRYELFATKVLSNCLDIVVLPLLILPEMTIFFLNNRAHKYKNLNFKLCICFISFLDFLGVS